MNEPATVGNNNDLSNIAKLKDSRDNLVQQLADITIKPKPTYEIDGQMVKWDEYQTSLIARIRSMNALINELDVGACGTEIITQAYT
jgi:hypothetical protein